MHALTDGDWVLGAGLLDLWRNPKRSYYGTKEANAPRYLALRVTPRNVYAEQGAKITVTAVNDLAARSGTLALELTDTSGSTLHQTTKEVSLAAGVSELLLQPLDTSAMKRP